MTLLQCAKKPLHSTKQNHWDIQIIGASARVIAKCFSEHLRSTRNNTPWFPVPQHFNSTRHSISDVQVRGVALCSGTDKGKIVSKYCNILKTPGRGFIHPRLPCTKVGVWICLCVGRLNAIDFSTRRRSAERTEYHFQFYLNWDIIYILRALLNARAVRSFLCLYSMCVVLYNGFFAYWRRVINPKRFCFLKNIWHFFIFRYRISPHQQRCVRPSWLSH